MRLQQLREFVVVATVLRFRKAAKELGVSPSALSHHIKALEEDLGIDLLERDHHTVVLTTAGQAYFDQVRTIVSQLDRATRLAKEIADGTVVRIRIGHISITSHDTLRAALTALRSELPQLQFHIVEAPTLELVAALLDHRIDLALVQPPLRESRIEHHRLYQERVTAIVPADHHLATKTSLTMTDLADTPFVVPPQTATTGGHERVLAACRRAGYQPPVLHEATSINSLLALVAAGAGVSIISRAALEHRRLPGVTPIPIAGVRPLPIHIAWRRDDTVPLLDIIRQHLTQLHDPPADPQETQTRHQPELDIDMA